MGRPGMSLAFFIPSLNILSRTCGFFSWAFSSSWNRSARRAAAPLSELRASSSPMPDLGLGGASWAITASTLGSIVRRPSQHGQVTLNVAMARAYQKSGRSAPGMTTLDVEAGQDGLEEGVLDQASDRVEDARAGLVEWAREIDPGRDFLAGAVLEDLGDPSHDTFVELLHGTLRSVLLGAVDHHVLEERLHVARYLAVPDSELGVQGEPARADVEFAVGPQHVVHRAQIGVVDLHREVEVGARSRGTEPEVGAGRTRSHEAAAELGHRGLPAG